jgi:hypothetical protein
VSQEQSSILYVGLLDSPSEDEKLEMFLSESAEGEVRITLRTIARSGLGWYPQKTISIHPVQLQALEILVKRARAMTARREAGNDEQPNDPRVIRLPYFNCPAVAD